MELLELAIVTGTPFILGFLAGYAVRAAISRARRKKSQAL
jgi:uncharacterized membrane protein (Fun14 family)